ncbi:MAG: hypothetical protein HFF39_02590 [Lawsonibacter sp.]|nr:hypothetical protein [Lawsonibacter sp.]
MATDKVQTGLRLDSAIYEKLKALSVRERRSMNNMVEYAVQRYLQEYEAANGPLPVDEEY